MSFNKLILEALEIRRKAGKKRNMKRYYEALEKVEVWHTSKTPAIPLSMLARCERMIYFKLTNQKKVEVDPHQRIMMDMRSAVHTYFQSLLYEAFDFIEIEYPLLDEKNRLIGKLDIVDMRTKYYYEIKTRNVFTFKKDKEAPDTKDFIQVQGAEMIMKKRKASLVYVDMNYFSQPVEHEVSAKPELQRKIMAKAKRLFQAVKDKELPKMNTDDCKICNYAYMCTKKKLVL